MEHEQTVATETTSQDIEKYVGKKQELEVDKIFRACTKLEGSDLHLKVGKPPYVRVRGTLRPLNRPPIEAEEMVAAVSDAQ